MTEDSQKAEAFNTYFSSVFTVDDGSDVSKFKESLSIQSSIIDSMKFTTEAIYEGLTNLHCDKACSPDLLPS